MKKKPIEIKETALVPVIEIPYKCPDCGVTSKNKSEFEKCIRSHHPNTFLYDIGDVVEFTHYPGDYCEYGQGVIRDRIMDAKGGIWYTIDEAENEAVEEDKISEVLMLAVDRKKLRDEIEEKVKTLPDTFKWTICWTYEYMAFYVCGIKK